MQFNTLFQLYDMVITQDPQLECAQTLLTMPDLLGYMLSGVASTEYTHATTTQLLDAKTAAGPATAGYVRRAGVAVPEDTKVR